jgi:DNA-binding transcriptional LysR family regulator
MAVAEHILAGRLVRLLPEYALPDLVLYAAYLPNPTMSQCVQMFVNFLCTEFGKQPYWDRSLGFAPDPIQAAAAG